MLELKTNRIAGLGFFYFLVVNFHRGDFLRKVDIAFSSNPDGVAYSQSVRRFNDRYRYPRVKVKHFSDKFSFRDVIIPLKDYKRIVAIYKNLSTKIKRPTKKSGLFWCLSEFTDMNSSEFFSFLDAQDFQFFDVFEIYGCEQSSEFCILG